MSREVDGGGTAGRARLCANRIARANAMTRSFSMFLWRGGASGHRSRWALRRKVARLRSSMRILIRGGRYGGVGERTPTMAKWLAILKCGCEDWSGLRFRLFWDGTSLTLPHRRCFAQLAGPEVTELHFKSLIIATGARERLLPFPDGRCRTCSALEGYRHWSKRVC